MMILNGQFPSIEQAASEYLEKAKSSEAKAQGLRSFAEVFEGKKTEEATLKFSKHAENRLSERNIELSDKVMNRLTAGMQAAGQKGINESLVLMDQMAFIVNVKNSTVITAMNETEIKDNVFTNIDGAIIV